ncbi:MAG: response regulator [Nitrospiraceae bacterium]
MAKILAVDDEQMFCDLLRTALGHHGHEVIMAFSGADAIEQFTRHRPDMTLLDLIMPGVNGIEVLKQIRAVDAKASVIVLTGAGSDELEDRARELGVTDFLRKGLSLKSLMGALDRVLTQSSQPAPTTPAKGPSGEMLPGDSILVVDDEPAIRDLLWQFLTGRGYRVRTAQDGVEAVAQVQQEPPRIVILDVFMPRMNGVEVLRELQRLNYMGAVIALSANKDTPLLKEMVNLGAVDSIGKPIDLKRLALVIQVVWLLNRMEQESTSAKPSGQSG